MRGVNAVEGGGGQGDPPLLNAIFHGRFTSYMKKNARSDRPFTPNTHERKRLNEWDNIVKATFNFMIDR